MITVVWECDGHQFSSCHVDPLSAAQNMSAVVMAENLTPVGWAWDTEEEWARVRSIRDGRDYGVDMRGMVECTCQSHVLSRAESSEGDFRAS